jgi:TetR/AcrR family transcriptional regulator of autoinduction and epiphytic fitness
MPETTDGKKKKDTGRKHQAILEGAIKVFIEKGYDVSSMDSIAEMAGVSKRTVYNHFQSKENLFHAVVGDFLAKRDEIKPIEYSRTLPIEDQLKEFAQAELYLINDPLRRGLSKFLTSFFLMDNTYARKLISANNPHHRFIIWLQSAKEDQKLIFQSPEIAAQIFYGLVEGCLTYPALLSDGEKLKHADVLLDEIALTFLSRFGCR